MNIVGMDLETNGADMATAVPIQIGVYDPNSTNFYDQLIYYYIQPKDWSEKAEGIHHIDHADILAYGETPEKVQETLTRWMNANELHKPWPIGWNVGGFDMAILQHHAPGIWDLFSHRTIDLNSLCKLVEMLQIPRADSPNPWKWDTLKKRVKRLAEYRASDDGWVCRPHDALYDAVTAWHSFEILIEMLKPYSEILEVSQDVWGSVAKGLSV